MLAVPGSSARMLAKAPGLPADAVFLDLEDAVAPDAKRDARRGVAAALADGDWAAPTRSVRVNDVTTGWAYRDVLEVVEAAGPHLHTIVLPKVTGPDHVRWLDLTLTSLERALGLPVGGIGIEPQVEDAAGLLAVDAIAAGPRVEAVVFGPADFMASVGMRSLVVGGQPPGYEGADAFHLPLMRILLAARAAGVQAVDGPYLQVRDSDGFRRQARRSAALGYDGKWVLHPDQIAAANEVYAPAQDDYDHAELILDAYEYHTTVRGVGAAMLGEEMIDEASRKMALGIAAKGRAAGLTRTSSFDPPTG